MLLLVICFICHYAVAADRQWYSLTIDGNRVGYAWHDHDQQSGKLSDSEVTRIEVEQLRQRVTVETRNEVTRSAAGLPQRMDVESIIGATRNGWQGTFSADARTLNVVVSTAAGTQTFFVPVDLILPDRLADALRPMWREGRREIEVQYLEPTAAKPIGLRAELLSLPNAEPRVAQVRTSETIGHWSHQEIIWIGEDGQILHRERKFFGAMLVWDRCLRDCDSRVDEPFDLMSKLVVQSPYRIPKGAFAGPIRYVISRVDGHAPLIPGTAEQAVVMDGSTAILTVCATCGVPEQLTESERRRYLQSNAFAAANLSTLVRHDFRPNRIMVFLGRPFDPRVDDLLVAHGLSRSAWDFSLRSTTALRRTLICARRLSAACTIAMCFDRHVWTRRVPCLRICTGNPDPKRLRDSAQRRC